MNTNTYNETSEPRIARTIIDDIRRGDFRQNVKRDYRELKEFFIDEVRRDRLKEMGIFKRWFYMSIWLLKSLFLKLTPASRILLVFSVVLLFSYSNTGNGNANVQFLGNGILGYTLLLFILMLELKDKLLAKDELEDGRSVQIALMPESNPSVPGWSVWLFSRPANDVGGDMVDHIQISEEKHGIALGDVAGKGLRAALLMAKLQSTLRSLVTDYHSMSELGEKINRIFCRDSLPNIFASLIYMRLDAHSDRINILNAGHMPPFIIRGKNLEEMSKSSPAIGLMPNAVYTEQSVTLKKGDILVAYSDGVTEAKNEFGEFFGDQRLRVLLQGMGHLDSKEAGKKLLDSVEYFVGEERYTDDLSLVIIKKT